MAQNINKETFEIFESLNIFDSLLPYKLSNSIYNKIFPDHKIVVGTEKNPNQQHKDLDASFYSRQKSYKTFSNVNNSSYDGFTNYSGDYPFKKPESIEEEILISEESKKFLMFFNKKEPTLNQQNILGYEYGFESINSFVSFVEFSEELEEESVSTINIPSVEKTVVEKIEKIIEKKEIFNTPDKESKTESIIEKIWEKKQEDIIQNNSETVVNNNFVNQNVESKTINNILNEKTLHNNITETFNSQNNSTLNIEQNILTQINNSITKITNNTEKVVENKLEKVVKEIHHQNKVDLSDAIMLMKKMIQEEKIENKSIQKNSKKEIDKTLEDFLRS